MLTLEQARTIRKKAEIKTALKFIIPTVLVAVISFLVFYFIDFNKEMSDYYKIYYLVPFAVEIVIIKLSGITEFFKSKEFIGEVMKNEIYRAEERKIKSGGFDALQDKSFESELMVRNKDGKTIFRVFPRGDATANLLEGDTVAVLRFVDEPVVIKGQYWK